MKPNRTRNQKVCLTLLLFAFLVELLLDPSTNFVRAGEANSKPNISSSSASSSMAIFILKVMGIQGESENQNEDNSSGGSRYFQDATVCYGIAVGPFQFNWPIPETQLQELQIQQQIDSFYRTIFQPPKHA